MGKGQKVDILTVRADGRLHSKHRSKAKAGEVIEHLALLGIALQLVEGYSATEYRKVLQRARGQR